MCSPLMSWEIDKAQIIGTPARISPYSLMPINAYSFSPKRAYVITDN